MNKYWFYIGLILFIGGLITIMYGMIIAITVKPFFDYFSFLLSFIGFFLILIGFFFFKNKKKINFLGDNDYSRIHDGKRKSTMEKIILFLIYLKEIFPSQIFRMFFKKKSKEDWEYRDACFVDKYVIFMFIISIISLFIADYILDNYSMVEIKLILWFIILWGVIRIIDIIVYHLYALLVTKGIELHSSHRMVALLFLNYFEILFWFAVLYRFFSNCFSENGVNSFHGSLYFSTVTMTTLGYGDIEPIFIFGKFLISVQTLIGLLILLVMIARFIPILSTKDKRKKDL